VRIVLVSLLAGALLACASLGSQPEFTSPVTTNKPRKNVMVQFTQASVHPSVARVLPGGNIVWINYADSSAGAVVFDESIKESFTCSDLRPLFSKVAAGYQSIPITSAGGENVSLPCPLKPGTYDYQIYLGGGGMGGIGIDDPQITLPAKIVVESPPTGSSTIFRSTGA
jgi:hypothetical protein